ncbi:hypothetical protein KFE25_007243 [Diacronema lutheri]|uniref:Uncharacterized protein n=1 Tax=Diacronema lutheri TaxID=2081491 RepID=A0A8J5X118_DIALT|nr:hypothetical protein KFE25_007243 [Diacronema lutheri]
MRAVVVLAALALPAAAAAGISSQAFLSAPALFEAVEVDLTVWKHCLEGTDTFFVTSCVENKARDALIYAPGGASTPISYEQAHAALEVLLAGLRLSHVALFPRTIFFGNNSVGFTRSGVYECERGATPLYADLHLVFMRLDPQSLRATHYFDYYDASAAAHALEACKGASSPSPRRAQADFAAELRAVERLVRAWNERAAPGDGGDGGNSSATSGSDAFAGAPPLFADDAHSCFSWWGLDSCARGADGLARALAPFRASSSFVRQRNALFNPESAWASLTVHTLCADGTYLVLDFEMLLLLRRAGPCDGSGDDGGANTERHVAPDGSRATSGGGGAGKGDARDASTELQIAQLEAIAEQDAWLTYVGCVAPPAHPPPPPSVPSDVPSGGTGGLGPPLVPEPAPLPLPLPPGGDGPDNGAADEADATGTDEATGGPVAVGGAGVAADSSSDGGGSSAMAAVAAAEAAEAEAEAAEEDEDKDKDEADEQEAQATEEEEAALVDERAHGAASAGVAATVVAQAGGSGARTRGERRTANGQPAPNGASNALSPPASTLFAQLHAHSPAMPSHAAIPTAPRAAPYGAKLAKGAAARAPPAGRASARADEGTATPSSAPLLGALVCLVLAAAGVAVSACAAVAAGGKQGALKVAMRRVCAEASCALRHGRRARDASPLAPPSAAEPLL